ncbi:MAG: hypothetical protein JW908_12465 [Anaerolineales bacterium]|nr:hypothetical protein [Anaerolineales bacterium]
MKRKEFQCRFVKAGRVRAVGDIPASIEILPGALARAWADGLFDNRAVFIDHAGAFDYPSLRNLVGVTLDAQYQELDGAIDGVVRLYNTPASQTFGELLDQWLNDHQAGLAAPDIGLSLVFYPMWEPVQAQEGGVRRISGIRHIESIDFVFEPATEARVVKALTRSPINDFPEGTDRFAIYSDACLSLRASRICAPINHHNFTQPRKENKQMSDHVLDQETPASQSETGAWQSPFSHMMAKAMLAQSDLPQASRERLAAREYSAPEQVTAAIDAEQAYLAKLTEDQVVQIGSQPPRTPHISLGRSGLEQVQLALEALISGVRPADGILPLTGIRELYNVLSGDYELTGTFKGERVYLANVTSATMSNMVANALNKVVAAEFQQYPRWWEPFVSQQDFASLQQVKWITLGGVGELPTVAEGAAYTELTWDDKYEATDFTKKGGYLGLTIEAIDKDDTGRLRAAPRALAQAAWLTLSKAVLSIFTANSGVGPTLSDSVALFHSSRNNLGSAALSWSAYVAARTAMRKQTELNSGERLGALTAPRFLLVPPDLEIAALQIIGSEGEPGGSENDVNPLSAGDTHDARLAAARSRIIVVDLWPDTNDWAAVADPRLYPSIGIGYRYGRVPEVFSVASPTAGLMFSNDTMPVKVRFFFAVGAMDYRGLYKSNVA